MTKYPINLAPGASVVIETSARVLYFESATAGGADTSIKVVQPGANGGELVLQIGQGFKTQQPFDRLIVSNNLGQGTILGYLVLADGDFIDHRSVGTVSVIDNSKAKSMGGTTFFRARTSLANPGNFSYLQIFNPATSGVYSAIKRLQISSVAAGNVALYYGQTNSGASPAAGVNKKIGGAISQTLVNSNNVEAVVPPTAIGAVTGIGTLSEGVSLVDVDITEPWILPPGWGISVCSSVLNTAVSIFVDFEEFTM